MIKINKKPSKKQAARNAAVDALTKRGALTPAPVLKKTAGDYVASQDRPMSSRGKRVESAYREHYGSKANVGNLASNNAPIVPGKQNTKEMDIAIRENYFGGIKMNKKKKGS